MSAATSRTGAGVLVIDHMAKGTESRKFRAGGTIAKKRADDGVVYHVENVVPFAPGSGGKTSLSIVKDRHGDIRANTPERLT